MRLHPIGQLTLVAGLVGCAAAPLSFISGQPKTVSDPTLYPVRIVSVDGGLEFSNPVQLEPGPRWLVVEAAPAHGARGSVQKSFVFTVAPCTRYAFAARRASPMASDWTLVVDDKEVVSGCDPKAEADKAKASRAPSK